MKTLFLLLVLAPACLASASTPECLDRQAKQDRLFAAAKYGMKEQIEEELWSAKYNVNARNSNGQTLLHVAVEHGHRDVALCLRHLSADIYATDNNGQTPLYIAIQKGNVGFALELFSYVIWSKTTLLHQAVKDGRLDIVNALLAHSVNPNTKSLIFVSSVRLNAQDHQEQTALHHAAIGGYSEIAQVLLNYNASIDDVDKRGWTPLHHAVSKGHSAIVKMLLEKGAFIEAENENGLTPLLLAAFEGHLDTAKLLLDSGASMDAVYGNGLTPLHVATLKNRSEIAKLFLKTGANMDAVSEDGLTPLHVAALSRHSDIVEILLLSGASRNVMDKYGWTPLHHAVLEGHSDVAKLLLDYGANMDAVDKCGMTPLRYANLKGHSDIAKLLLENGADNGHVLENEQTTECHAAMHQHFGVIDALQKCFANLEILDECDYDSSQDTRPSKKRRSSDHSSK